jgi:hypothetical protein
MFCSSTCAHAYKKKPTKEIKPIKKFSDVRAKRNVLYIEANRIFLLEEKNQFCIVMAELFNRTVRATEVHHTNGRENERLLDRTYWMAVSREGHQWIHNNPKKARELGWLI